MSKQSVIENLSEVDKTTLDKDVWSFPDMEVDDASEPIFGSENVDSQKDRENIKSTKPKSISPEELLRIKEEHEREIALIKSEYDKKIESIDKLLGKLENPLTVFDNELIDLINAIIKKIVTKIIYKEIESDPKVILSMIEELKKILEEDNNEIATIYLSEIDHNKLNKKDKNSKLGISVDTKLHEGDIVIKSKLGEIRALLVERIDQVLGNKHG